jgi:hypothetical protein
MLRDCPFTVAPNAWSLVSRRGGPDRAQKDPDHEKRASLQTAEGAPATEEMAGPFAQEVGLLPARLRIPLGIREAPGLGGS